MKYAFDTRIVHRGCNDNMIASSFYDRVAIMGCEIVEICESDL